MTCVAPQTRAYWNDYLRPRTDKQLLDCLRTAKDGVARWKHESTRHRHDWTIFYVCALHEVRRRGLDIPPDLGT